MTAQSVAVEAILRGDVAVLTRLLDSDPQLARMYLGDPWAGRTLLHVATDWPGHRPMVAQVIASLVVAGADPDAPFAGGHRETALHWAASCDDVVAATALLDAGADIDAPGAALGDGSGTPLFDAVAYRCWKVARHLVTRGATSDGWSQAALGMSEHLAERIVGASQGELDRWLWAAAHGGQLGCVRMLLASGADARWRAQWDGSTAHSAALDSADAGTPGAAEVAQVLHCAGG